MEITLKRYHNNPILTPTKNAWENRAVFNAGVTMLDGRIALLYRAQGDDNISRFGLAFSDDGYQISERLDQPIFEPDEDTQYETRGVEDPRISQIGDNYYITYTAASLYPKLFNNLTEERRNGHTPWRVRVSIAHTTDFQTFTRHGVIISHIDSKDGCLFPSKLHHEFILIHRVVPQLRLAIATDLHDFEERGAIFGPRGGAGWDGKLVGAGAPPIKTPHGWVLIYHGVNERGHYSLGAALLDPHDPIRVLYRSPTPILAPELPYEREGIVPHVVFCCGAVQKNDELLVYYGAADTRLGVASLPYQQLLDWAEYHYHHRR